MTIDEEHMLRATRESQGIAPDATETPRKSTIPAAEPVAEQWRALEDGEPRTSWKDPDLGDRPGWAALAARNSDKYAIEKRALYASPQPARETDDRDAEIERRNSLSNLIKTRLLGVHPEDQDLVLEDDDWMRVITALEGQKP